MKLVDQQLCHLERIYIFFLQGERPRIDVVTDFKPFNFCQGCNLRGGEAKAGTNYTIVPKQDGKNSSSETANYKRRGNN